MNIKKSASAIVMGGTASDIHDAVQKQQRVCECAYGGEYHAKLFGRYAVAGRDRT
jgi:hypothetical protein